MAKDKDTSPFLKTINIGYFINVLGKLNILFIIHHDDMLKTAFWAIGEAE